MRLEIDYSALHTALAPTEAGVRALVSGISEMRLAMIKIRQLDMQADDHTLKRRTAFNGS